jgi:hypothetical protein
MFAATVATITCRLRPTREEWRPGGGEPLFAVMTKTGDFMKNLFATMALLGAAVFGSAANAQDVATPMAATSGPAPVPATGTLVVEIKPFTSEKPLPAKVEKQLRSGGLEWGTRDNEIVFTMVNKQFVDFPINHMTRYGQNEQLNLPAGEYHVTGLGMEMNAGFNVQKILDRGAFVNNDVVTFRIEAGKTTTLSINPVIRRDNALMVNFWMPTLLATVIDEIGRSEEKALNVRGETSIGWPQYHGPLKFVAE